MKIKKFYENSVELPKSVDIDAELNEIRSLQKKMNDINLPHNPHEKISDIMKNDISEWKTYVNNITEIEEEIKNKIQPILTEYLNNMDYEGAKWFVGRSYKDVLTAGKTLLFRQILLHEKEKIGKYNL